MPVRATLAGAISGPRERDTASRGFRDDSDDIWYVQAGVSTEEPMKPNLCLVGVEPADNTKVPEGALQVELAASI